MNEDRIIAAILNSISFYSYHFGLKRGIKMRSACPILLAVYALNAYAGPIAAPVPLGAADPFAVLAGSTVTNTGPTVINGDLGVWPGTSITGFPPGVVNGSIHDSDSFALQAQTSLTNAINFAGSEPCGTTLTGQNLGGLTLTPGVYCFSSSAQLTGTLTLDSQGDSNAVFLFLIGSTLTTAGSSDVLFANGGSNDVFWDVGSSATLGAATSFEGSILALNSITLNTGASIGCGRALASMGAVTLDGNTVSDSGTSCDAGGGEAPEPSTVALLGIGLLGVGFYGMRIRGRSRSVIRAAVTVSA